MTDPTHTDPVREPQAARDDNSPDSVTTAAEERASQFATHRDPTLNRGNTGPTSTRPGVQWVSPTDIAARAGSVIVDRGVELHTRLRDAVLEGVRDGRAHLQDRLARRQAQLDQETAPTRTPQRSLGRTGVSR